MKIISRKSAKAEGLKHYFTGEPCHQGHLAKRYVSTAQCTECKYEQYKGQDGKLRKAKAAKNYRESSKGRVHRLFDNARRRAKKKGLEFSIDATDIKIPEKCPITGIKIEFGDDGGLNLSSPSLDRIDNSKGYIKGNVSVISNKANKYKSDMTIEIIEKLASYVAKSKA
jgi:hypothetical protein